MVWWVADRVPDTEARQPGSAAENAARADRYRHVLKCWAPYYAAVADGSKSFGVCRDDRTPPFSVGDTLVLRECDPNRETLTGRVCERVVTYVLEGGQFGLDSGYVVMGLARGARFPKTAESAAAGVGEARPAEPPPDEQRKIAAYDAARATVKVEGNTRAYYVLRAEAATVECGRLREQLDAAREALLNFDHDRARAALGVVGPPADTGSGASAAPDGKTEAS